MANRKTSNQQRKRPECHTPDLTITHTEVVRAKMKTMGMLGLNDTIDDILITLGEQYHLLRPVTKQNGLFLYFVLDKSKSNLALARRALTAVEKALK